MNPSMSFVAVPVEVADEVNAKILAVSEDQLQGFQRDPFGVVAKRTGLDRTVVLERVRAMLEAGVIRVQGSGAELMRLGHGQRVSKFCVKFADLRVAFGELTV